MPPKTATTQASLYTYSEGVAAHTLPNPTKLTQQQINDFSKAFSGLKSAKELEEKNQVEARDALRSIAPHSPSADEENKVRFEEQLASITHRYGKSGTNNDDSRKELVFAVDNSKTKRRDDCIQMFVVREYPSETDEAVMVYELCLRVHVVNATLHFPENSSFERAFRALVKPHYFPLTEADPIRHRERPAEMYFKLEDEIPDKFKPVGITFEGVPAITGEFHYTVKFNAKLTTEEICLSSPPSFTTSIVRLEEAATFDDIVGEVKLSSTTTSTTNVSKVSDIATIHDAVCMSPASEPWKGSVSFDLLRAATMARVLADRLREQSCAEILNLVYGHTEIPLPPRRVHVNHNQPTPESRYNFLFADAEKGTLDVLGIYSVAASQEIERRLTRDEDAGRSLFQRKRSDTAHVNNVIECIVWLLSRQGVQTSGVELLRTRLSSLTPQVIDQLYRRLFGISPENPDPIVEWSPAELLEGSYTHPARCYKSLLRQRILGCVIAGEIDKARQVLEKEAADNTIPLKCETLRAMSSNADAVSTRVLLESQKLALDTFRFLALGELPTCGVVVRTEGFAVDKARLRLKLPAVCVAGSGIEVEVDWPKKSAQPPTGTTLLVLVRHEEGAYKGRLFYRQGCPLRAEKKKSSKKACDDE